MTGLFQYASGQTTSPHIVFVGEAWGETEETFKLPFAGQSGREFARMLSEAWEWPELQNAANDRSDESWLGTREVLLSNRGVLLTNVFAFRPNNNNLAALCCDAQSLPQGYSLGPVRSQSPRYVRPEFLGELTRLRAELEAAKPNLCVALGATAAWALLSSFAIGSIRGSLAPSTLVPGLKILPTYHPAGVLYQWGIRGTCVADLVKARNEMEHSDIVRPSRDILVDESIEIIEAQTRWILDNAKILAPDIETFKGQIRCIGFAWSRKEALVIPFFHASKDRFVRNHWSNEEDELRAWACVRKLLESPIPKLFQNGMFDLQYLYRAGIRTANCAHDTMLLHHSLYPELPKALGYLGSIYTNEQAWKLLRRHGEELKRDE